MPENKPLEITDDQFEKEVLQAEGVSVVDFWAPWCGPCHAMAPALETFAEANAGSVRVFKIDADDNPKTAEKYGIRSVPTVVFFKNGAEIERVAGTMSQATLQSKLDGLLKEKGDPL